ncbi:MAG: hypothetical protein J5716_07370 [Alphaproteobacteria bacterium]|nr:hypothetical protein [Alphaproteobacteria bacterium]
MKVTLKNTLMTLTVLSSGFFILSSGTALAGLKKLETKPAATSNEALKQYPLLGVIKNEVTEALNLHQQGLSFPTQKEQLEKHHEEVEKYNEIERRLSRNTQCNISLLNEHFSNGNAVWRKIAAYAEDTSATLLAEAAGAMGSSEASGQLKDLEGKVDSGDLSDDGSSSSTSSSSSPYSNINENTSEAQASAMISQGESSAKAKADQASQSDMDLGEAAVFGKIRWDVGHAVLKDLYRYPAKWGTLKKKFSPWVDQKYVYDQYLEKFYKEKQSRYIWDPLKPFPPKPELSKGDSYLPGDYYSGEVPEKTVSSTNYNENTANADDRWCGQTNGKKNVCTRINKGSLYTKHQAYMAALTSQHQLKPGVTPPNMEPPYLPQVPLPPWRESVYIMNVEKELPEFASELPEPWYLVTVDIDNYTSDGELSNLVEKHRGTIRYRPRDYDAETGVIKKDRHGNPKIPIPLVSNRISAYLSLQSAKEEQKPVKEKALVSIKEINESLVASLKEMGCVIPNANSFDLSNPADYQKARNELKRVKNAKISSAQSKIQKLKAQFGGKLYSSVKQVLNEEEATLKALKKDTAFLVNITRENAPDINSLIMKAVADATANETYKANVDKQMEDAAAVPAVGCPVL